MKNYFSFVLTALFCLAFLFCHFGEASAQTAKKYCSIKDRLFVQQINDIRLNPQNYKDQIIQIEGFFMEYRDQEYIVYRNTAGCCGADGMVGFEFKYKGGKLNFKQGEWVLVEGQVAKGKIYDKYIYLEATSVIKKEQGKAKGFVM